MNWKLFLIFPLAALVTAKPLQAPVLKPTIPLVEDESCNYRLALHYYLQAYAYAREAPKVSRKFLSAAERERKPCIRETKDLQSRILALRKALPL